VRADSDGRKSRRSIELYVIIDGGLLGGADAEKVLEAALRGGADAVQFRAKHFSKRSYYETAAKLLAVTRPQGIPFFVNDHLDVALAISADGIHLGQNDLPCRAARALVPHEMILGTSTHSLHEAARAVEDGVDYVAIGSVFPTSTKENPEAIIGTEMVREVRRLVGQTPLIAIGGITANNVGDVIRAGADGVAVASAVVLADDPCAAAKELKERIRSAKDDSA